MELNLHTCFHDFLLYKNRPKKTYLLYPNDIFNLLVVSATYVGFIQNSNKMFSFLQTQINET